MKCILIALNIFVANSVFAQKEIEVTHSIHVHGQLNRDTVFTIQDLLNLNNVEIQDVSINNHEGEHKGDALQMRGIPLKDIFMDLKFDVTNTKQLSELYFVLTASDGYTVLYSWNELYNTEVGNHVYILTQMHGQNLTEMNNRIICLSTLDLKTGRRYVKGLKEIEVVLHKSN
jgi:hypothetical protein